MKFEWYDKEFLKKTTKEAHRACKRGAQIVRNDAKRRVPVESGALKRSIRVKESKFKEKGGYIVLTGGIVSGKDTYYWRWVHYGSKRHKKERVPYMTQALEANRNKIIKEFKDIL